MRGPNEPDDGFRLPPTPAPAPAAPTQQEQRQSEFEKDDWLPDGLRRKKPQPKPECNDLAIFYALVHIGWACTMPPGAMVRVRGPAMKPFPTWVIDRSMEDSA